MEKESAADSWLASLTNKISDVPDTVAASHCFQGRAIMRSRNWYFDDPSKCLGFTIQCHAGLNFILNVFSETEDDLELEFNQLANRNKNKNTNPFRVAI